jgi:hypothetical protein
MVCNVCDKESADEFSFCPHCGKQKATRTVCPSCAKELVGEFSFCPHCGKALVSAPPAVEPSAVEPSVSPSAVNAISEQQTEEQQASEVSNADKSNKIGTWVFGSFSALALLVSIIKGIVPIYLIESAIWAGAAWYWHSKKTHSELAKAIVIVFASLIAIGEVIQIAKEFVSEPKQTRIAAPNPIDDLFQEQHGSPDQSQAVATSGASAASHVAGIEQQAVALFSQKQYKEARPLFEQACNGTDENGFKYAGFDGEMKACNYLGYLYAQGLGGPHETKKARDAYQKACDQGILPSCASLGTLYQDAGDGSNARKYFQKACDGGVAEACGLLRGVL